MCIAMKHLLLLLAVSFFMLLALAQPCMAGEPLLFVTDNDFPPYAFQQDGELRGVDVDIVREMAKRAGLEVDILPTPWRRLMRMLRSGKADGGFSLFKTRERDDFFLYVDATPIHSNSMAAFVTADSALTVNALEDLYGLKVGVNTDFSVSAAFDQARARGLFTVLEKEGVMSNVLALAAGRIDVFVHTRDVALHILKNANKLDAVRECETSFSNRRPAYLVLSKASPLQDKKQLQRRLNAILLEMEQSGELTRIHNNYLK